MTTAAGRFHAARVARIGVVCPRPTTRRGGTWERRTLARCTSAPASTSNRSTTPPVSDITQLRPGDLLFAPGADGTMTAPGHVGIYLGSGLVIDAPTTGQTVHIGPMEPYWSGNLAGIRRIANP